MDDPHLCHVDISAFVNGVCVVGQEEKVSTRANQAATQRSSGRCDQAECFLLYRHNWLVTFNGFLSGDFQCK